MSVTVVDVDHGFTNTSYACYILDLFNISVYITQYKCSYSCIDDIISCIVQCTQVSFQEVTYIFTEKPVYT